LLSGYGGRFLFCLRRKKMAYTPYLGPKNQREIAHEDQVPNSAGGYAFEVDSYKQLDRFLVLGTLAGTYYIKPRDLTQQNLDVIKQLIASDGQYVVKRVVEISDSGRSSSNDPALLVLALCASAEEDSTRRFALNSLPKVARIGTHLFTFAEYVQQFRGWGRALRTAVGKWYTDQPIDKLTYQMLKYRQRNGWSHADLLRLSHPKPPTAEHDFIFAWATGSELTGNHPRSELFAAYQEAQTADKGYLVRLIMEHNLTREMIPTDYLNDPDVQYALLQKMPATALIRNLGNMSKSGLLVDTAWDVVNEVVDKLTETEWLRKSRIHPVALFNAYKTYGSGRGFRGSGSWEPVPNVIDALEDAFYKSFDFVEPTGKRHMLALDVSGSMTWAGPAGLVDTDFRQAAALMAMVTYRTEPSTKITAFSASDTWRHAAMRDVTLTRKMTLNEVTRTIDQVPAGGTDCAAPIVYALKNGLMFDVFVVYTDSETWAGNIHPHEALEQYRRKTGIDAKLVVVGMAANPFSIANPNDAGMLDVVGFDTNTPKAISEFVRL